MRKIFLTVMVLFSIFLMLMGLFEGGLDAATDEWGESYTSSSGKRICVCGGTKDCFPCIAMPPQ